MLSNIQIFPTSFGRLYIIVICMFLLLVGCGESSEQLSKSRFEYLAQQDKNSSCRMYALSDSFEVNNVKCDAFLETDNECQFFPEKKLTCKAFLSQKYYLTSKQLCKRHKNIVNYCQNNYEQNSWYSGLLNYRNNSVLHQTLLFLGIDLKKKWYQDTIFLYKKSYLDIVVIKNIDDDSTFYNGAQLAAELINKKSISKVRKIRVILKTAENNNISFLKLSNEIRNMKSVVAAVDGQQSPNNKLFSQLYEQVGIMHFIATDSRVNLLRQNMQLGFRLLPNNEVIAQESVKFFAKQSFQNVAVLIGESDASDELGRMFLENAVKQRVNVAYTKRFFQKRSDFSEIISEMASKKVDAIYLVTDWTKLVAKIMTQAQLMGYSFKFIGTRALESESLINSSLNVETSGLTIPSVFNPTTKLKNSKLFFQLYQEKYGVQPDLEATLAFDAVNLIAYSVYLVGSSSPRDLASNMRHITDWTGVNGQYQFNIRGELKNNKIIFKVLQQGKFKSLEESKL